MKNALTSLLLVAGLFSLNFAQEPNQSLHPGISLFSQGKFSDAVRSLELAVKSKEHKNDAEIWNYLGLAYVVERETKKGVKALEKSAKLKESDAVIRANLAYAHLLNSNLKKAREHANRAVELDARTAMAYQVRSTVNLREHKLGAADQDADSFISLDETNPQAYILKSTIALSQFGTRVQAGRAMKDEAGLLKSAMDTLASGVVKAKANPKVKRLEQELESISVFYKYFTREPAVPGGTPRPPGVEPFRILAKPRAQYSDEARMAGVEGKIRVAVLLGANGKIDYVLFLSRLGSGLDEKVLEAIAAISFEPKRIDGRAVPTVVMLEYSFDIY